MKKLFPFYPSHYYIHPVVTTVQGKKWANICRGGKWMLSYCYGWQLSDAVYYVHDLNARLPEIG